MGIPPPFRGVLKDPTNGLPRQMSAEQFAFFSSISALKKELCFREIDTDTPGLKGDERATALAERLWEDIERLETEAKQAELSKIKMTIAQEEARRQASAQDCGNVVLLRDLDSALVRRNQYQIEECIRAGADVNYETATGHTPLIYATVEGQKKFIKTLVLHLGASIDRVNKYGHTAVTWGAICGKTDIVQLLIELGANVSIETFNGRTALSAGKNLFRKLYFCQVFSPTFMYFRIQISNIK